MKKWKEYLVSFIFLTGLVGGIGYAILDRQTGMSDNLGKVAGSLDNHIDEQRVNTEHQKELQKIQFKETKEDIDEIKHEMSGIKRTVTSGSTEEERRLFMEGIIEINAQMSELRSDQKAMRDSLETELFYLQMLAAQVPDTIWKTVTKTDTVKMKEKKGRWYWWDE